MGREMNQLLRQLGDSYQRNLRAREELPGLLADLIESGQERLALEATVAWGRALQPPVTIRDRCRAARQKAR